MKLKSTILPVFCLIFLLVPVFSAQGQDAGDEIYELKSRIRALEDYILTIQPTLDEFNKSTKKTFDGFYKQTQEGLNEYAKNLHNHVNEKMQGLDQRTVSLDVVSKGYRKIETSSGTFLISIKRLKPVFGGGGYRLTFNVGNPNYAGYSGINITLRWGEKYNEKSLQSYEAWKNSLVGAKYSYGGRLSPGAWTEFSVDVPVESTKQLGYIECSLDLDSIELNLKNPQAK